MFGLRKVNDQNPTDNQQLPDSSQLQNGTSINGYVSPYLGADTPAPGVTSQAPAEPSEELEQATVLGAPDPARRDADLPYGGTQDTDVNQPSSPVNSPENVPNSGIEVQTEYPSYIQQYNEELAKTAPGTSNSQTLQPSLEIQGSVPTVESLATKIDEYGENTLLDKNINPEKDLKLQEGVPEDQNIKVHQKELKITELLDLVIDKNASDLHITVGYPAKIRIDSKLRDVGQALTADDVKELLSQTLNTTQKELLEVNKEVDLSYAHGNKARFRVNAYTERNNLAAAYRLIPAKIKSIEELGLPSTLFDFTRLSQGLFLVTGPTGSGKSTTLAAMLQEINENYEEHIITIEDPIEFVYPKAKALVDQRELGQDTHDWSIAMRSILRQDPDVVLIGEMRDLDTIQSALTIAETGHLVFATLHTNSAAESIDRIIDVFPPHQQAQVRTQLAASLKGILSQRLIPMIGGGRQAAVELMIVNSAIQNLIREGKTYQIDNIISTSFDLGMCTLERSLVKMIREGKISVEIAQEFAIRPQEVLKLMKSSS